MWITINFALTAYYLANEFAASRYSLVRFRATITLIRMINALLNFPPV